MGLISGISDFLKAGAYNYCQIETNESKYNFVTKDGGLLTIFEIEGTYKITSDNALVNKHENIVDLLKGNMAQKGYRLQFIFTRDPAGSKREVSQSLNPVKQTMRRLNLGLNSMIVEREELLGGMVAKEKCYLVIETKPTVLPSQLLKQANKERLKKSNGVGLKPSSYGQSPFLKYEQLMTKHESFVNSVTHALDANGVFTKKLDVYEALYSIRMEYCPDFTSDSWRPRLLGDKIATRLIQEDSGNDISHIMQPNIGMQIFAQEPEIPLGENGSYKNSLVQVGNRIYAPLNIDTGPQDAKPFNDLFNNIPSSVPWRLSLTIETGSQEIKSKLGTKKGFATFLKFSNSNNQLIMDACDQLIGYCDEGRSISKYKH